MSVVEELCDLLDQERKLLLAGDVGEVARLADLKVRLLGGLKDAGDLTVLRSKLDRNAVLLAAAAKAIRAALDQIADARAGGAGRQTYGPDGSRADLCIATRLEHRA